MAAGRSISGVQNGFAMAGDYLSASTFLGFAGLIFLFGLDGWVGLAAAARRFVPVVLLLAERMRNAGKFTIADVLAFRLRERPARMAAALGHARRLVLLPASRRWSARACCSRRSRGSTSRCPCVLTGTFMLVYVVLGGMLATTWVQIIKAGLLMVAGVVLTVLVLAKTGFDPFSLFDTAPSTSTPDGKAYLTAGQQYPRRSTGSPSAWRCCSAPPGCPTC